MKTLICKWNNISDGGPQDRFVGWEDEGNFHVALRSGFGSHSRTYVEGVDGQQISDTQELPRDFEELYQKARKIRDCEEYALLVGHYKKYRKKVA